jgi:hypothetical protein
MLLKSVEKLSRLIADMSVGEIADHVQFSYKDTEIRTETDYERASRLIPEVHKPWLDSWRRAAFDALNDIVLEVSDGFVRMPVDMNGIPIRMGDRVAEPEYAPNGGTVIGMKLYEGWDHWLINCGAWVDSRNCHHAEPDTWERIIADALNQGDAQDPAALVARCRALAGETE